MPLSMRCWSTWFHCLANLHGDPPGGVLVYLKVTRQLESRQSLLGVQHEHDGQEPLLQGHVGVVKDGADGNAESGPAVVAAMAVLHRSGVVGFAVRADGLVIPSCFLQVGDAVFLGGELLEYLGDVHGATPLNRG